jgi:hypothetical protein
MTLTLSPCFPRSSPHSFPVQRCLLTITNLGCVRRVALPISLHTVRPLVASNPDPARAIRAHGLNYHLGVKGTNGPFDITLSCPQPIHRAHRNDEVVGTGSADPRARSPVTPPTSRRNHPTGGGVLGRRSRHRVGADKLGQGSRHHRVPRPLAMPSSRSPEATSARALWRVTG